MRPVRWIFKWNWFCWKYLWYDTYTNLWYQKSLMGNWWFWDERHLVGGGWNYSRVWDMADTDDDYDGGSGLSD